MVGVHTVDLVLGRLHPLLGSRSRPADGRGAFARRSRTHEVRTMGKFPTSGGEKSAHCPVAGRAFPQSVEPNRATTNGTEFAY